MDGRRTDKHEVIEYVLKTCGIKDRGVQLWSETADTIWKARGRRE